MNKTPIEWVKNPDGTQGYTWNPITGCLNHVDGLCKGGNFPCYAYRLANRRLRTRYLANSNTAQLASIGEKRNPFYPRFWPKRLWTMSINHRNNASQKQKGYFVCNMGDLFGIGVPKEWTERVIGVCRDCPEHRFYLLTKQPQNLAKFSPFPDNCWVGVTACNGDMFWNALVYLRAIEAKIKYISIEPLLDWPESERHFARLALKSLSKFVLNQIIIGAQTKPYKPPKIEWVEEVVTACDKADIKVFLKDNLKPLLGNNLRQEMPINLLNLGVV